MSDPLSSAVLSLFHVRARTTAPCDLYFNCNYGGGTQTNTSGWGGFNWGNRNYRGTQTNVAGKGTPG
ncbi:MAG: hypothetical protein ACRDRY_15270 [Pseudonocardiaceae bacterium]